MTPTRRLLLIALVVLLVPACAGKKNAKMSADLDSQAVTVSRAQGSEASSADDSGAWKSGNSSADPGSVAHVFFDFDRYELRAEARQILAKNAGYLKSNPDVHVVIEGHCDEFGTHEYNLALGDLRAQATKKYLVSLGVAPDRIETVSYGKEKPFCSRSGNDCWAQNRRAHFLITAQQGA